MSEIALRLGKRGWLLRSGGAPGADTAFYEGIGYDADTPASLIEIFFPWKGFNLDVREEHIVLNEPSPEASKLAAEYHPAWPRLSQGAKKLIARDSHQVLGTNLDDPVDVIICWTLDGKPKGGTAQAIRIAKAFNIPVLNLGLPLTDRLISDIIG